jgi:hypothetical protein
MKNSFNRVIVLNGLTRRSVFESQGLSKRLVAAELPPALSSILYYKSQSTSELRLHS